MKIKTVIILSALLAVSFFLRFYKIASHDLWYDEVASVNLAHKVEHAAEWNKHPPFYFFFLKAWIRAFGDSEGALRIPSLIFGCLSVPIIYALGSLLFGTQVGLLSAAILVFSPMQVWYAQEARPYTLLPLFTMLAAYFLFKALKKNRVIFWAGFSLALSLAFYTTYISLLLIPAAIAVFIKEEQRRILKKNFYISLGCALAVFSLCLPVFINRYAYHASRLWFGSIGWYEPLITLINFIVGFNSAPFVDIPLLAVSIFLIFFVAIEERSSRKAFTQSMLFLIIPLGFVFYYSLYFSPIYRDRQLLMVAPFFYILIARGVVLLRFRLARVFVIGMLFLSMSFSLINYYQDIFPEKGRSYRLWLRLKYPVKPLAQYLKERVQPEDYILHTNFSTETILRYYWKDIPNPQALFIISSGDGYVNAWVHAAERFKDVSRIVRIPEDINDIRSRRIWLIISSIRRDGRVDEESVLGKIKRLEKVAVFKEWSRVAGVYVLLFEKKDTL